MRFDRWVFAACSAATLAACGGGNDSGNSGASLNVQLIGLENMGASSVYKGWLIVNNAAKSAGRFTVDHRGSMSQTTFKIDSADIAGSSAYVLTIEPQNDTDLGPTKTHLLAGNFDVARTQAALSVARTAALGNDFISATGKSFLATPSNPGTDDQGIWWVDASSGTPKLGLNLPALP